METTAAESLQTITGALGARKAGSSWVAHCPAHDDRNPSLSLSIRNGKLLVHCHAGCSQERVLAALREQGLWTASTSNGDYPAEWGVLTATYDYVDEVGRLLFQVCRFVPKTFRPRRPDGRGGWRWGYGNVRRVLYRLPEVIEAPIIFVTEGEKDVEILREHGFVATTNAGGAEARWLPGFTDALRGHEVILLPDNDPPGRQRVIRVARLLVDHVARLSILELEGAKDVAEWFDQGHSELELIHLVEAQHAS